MRRGAGAAGAAILTLAVVAPGTGEGVRGTGSGGGGRRRVDGGGGERGACRTEHVPSSPQLRAAVLHGDRMPGRTGLCCLAGINSALAGGMAAGQAGQGSRRRGPHAGNPALPCEARPWRCPCRRRDYALAVLRTCTRHSVAAGVYPMLVHAASCDRGAGMFGAVAVTLPGGARPSSGSLGPFAGAGQPATPDSFLQTPLYSSPVMGPFSGRQLPPGRLESHSSTRPLSAA